jgi:hypothetical protein
MRKNEVFFKRLSVQKSPKGAAGLAQQVRKNEVFFKRLSVQKSPKGAARLAQQVRKNEVFFRRLSMQKSPKGAAGLAQRVHKIEVFFKRPSVQKSPKGAAGLAQRVQTKIEGALHQRKSLQAQPDRHNKRAKTRCATPYQHSQMREGTQPHHTNYSCMRTARASHLTLVQLSE